MNAFTQVPRQETTPTHHAYAVEVDDATVGIVVRDGNAYTFYAATRPFFPLDQQRFTSPAAAQSAARALHGNRSHTLRTAAWRKAG